MVTLVTKMPCTRGDIYRSTTHTVYISKSLVYYMYTQCVCITSGIAMGGKGLRSTRSSCVMIAIISFLSTSVYKNHFLSSNWIKSSCNYNRNKETMSCDDREQKRHFNEAVLLYSWTNSLKFEHQQKHWMKLIYDFIITKFLKQGMHY